LQGGDRFTAVARPEGHRERGPGRAVDDARHGDAANGLPRLHGGDRARSESPIGRWERDGDLGGDERPTDDHCRRCSQPNAEEPLKGQDVGAAVAETLNRPVDAWNRGGSRRGGSAEGDEGDEQERRDTERDATAQEARHRRRVGAGISGPARAAKARDRTGTGVSVPAPW
jgi:hypothetical protein